MSGKKNAHPGLELIDFNNPREVRYWMNKLRCNKQELLHAIEVLGNSAQAVNASLRPRMKGAPFTADYSDPPDLSTHFFRGSSFFKSTKSSPAA